MRANILAKTVRVTAVTGIAVAVSSAVFATAAAADPTASSTPNPTTTSAPATTPAPTASPAPTTSTPTNSTPNPTASAATNRLDASVAITTRVLPGPPKSALAAIQVRSTRPTASYRLTITMADGLDMHAPGHPGWDCDLGDGGKDGFRYTCQYTGSPTAAPADVKLAFELPQEAGRAFELTATVGTTEPDSKPSNNTASRTIVVPGDKPDGSTGSGTISGRVWHDLNINGRQDKGEKAVAGARIVLTVADGTKARVLGRATTGADGRYRFTRLPAAVGRYGVAVAAPSVSWNFTDPGVGAEAGDSDFRRVNTSSSNPGTPFSTWFGTRAIVGIHDRTDVFAGKTTVLDAGLIRGDGDVQNGGDGDGGSLPVTGAGAAGILGAGAMLLAGGVALTVIARRRRTNA